MSDFGYDKLKYSDNLTVSHPDPNTKEGREYLWDDRFGAKCKQVFIDHDTAGLIEVLQLSLTIKTFHATYTKEMKEEYIKSDQFKEVMDKYRESFKTLENRDKDYV